MRQIVHLSDLHFGSEDPVVLAGLIADLDGRNHAIPSLVAISGDLTQRARKPEFCAAKAFLNGLRCPYLVVPGNHDVPLYDVVSRFLHPFDRYRRIISSQLEPTYVDELLAVQGLNTAHGFTFKDGKVTVAQATSASVFFVTHKTRHRILVAHHPFVVSANHSSSDLVDGAHAALPLLEDAGVDLILSGHLHLTSTLDSAGFRSPDRTIIAVQAGTCISTRHRGEPNSYNCLTIEGERLTIVSRTWNGQKFVDGKPNVYRRENHRWRHDS